MGLGVNSPETMFDNQPYKMRLEYLILHTLSKCYLISSHNLHMVSSPQRYYDSENSNKVALPICQLLKIIVYCDSCKIWYSYIKFSNRKHRTHTLLLACLSVYSYDGLSLFTGRPSHRAFVGVCFEIVPTHWSIVSRARKTAV